MGWLAAFALAAANVALYGSFARPYAEALGGWLTGGLLTAGAAVFVLVPLVAGSSVARAWRVRGGKAGAGPILLASLFLYNGAAAAAVCVLTPREALVERVQWLPRRLAVAGLLPKALVRPPDDPRFARDVAPVVVRGRAAAVSLDFEGLDEAFVESHSRAGATESGAAAYALSKGLLAVSDLKGFLDGKALTGADKAAVEALAEEHKAFERKWKEALDGFEPGKEGAGGRPFLSESLALFKKTGGLLVPARDAAARAEARAQAQTLTAEFLRGAVFTTEGPGRVRVDYRPPRAEPSLPVSLRLVFEDGRWRSEAHMAMAPKEVALLVERLRREATPP